MPAISVGDLTTAHIGALIVDGTSSMIISSVTQSLGLTILIGVNPLDSLSLTWNLDPSSTVHVMNSSEGPIL